MNDFGQDILQGLERVAVERAARAADPALAARVAAVKLFQHARFAHTYDDLMGDARYRRATAFFLDDLYGPSDFSLRDTQFARIVPALVRLFPREIVGTVAQLSALHALSEKLDSAMGRNIADGPITGTRYGAAWRAVGEPALRERQIALMLDVGTALDRYTRNPLLRNTLRLMRGPAHAAGLGALQRFLENGFESFRVMRGAAEFLGIIAQRERGLAQQLFSGKDAPDLPLG